MRPHTNLDVWKKAVDFTVEIYRVTESSERRKIRIDKSNTAGFGFDSGKHCRRRGTKVDKIVFELSVDGTGVGERS